MTANLKSFKVIVVVLSAFLISAVGLTAFEKFSRNQHTTTPKEEQTLTQEPFTNFDYSGEIASNQIEHQNEASHVLQKDSKIIAYLTTNDDKLTIAEGVKVAINGKIVKQLSGIPLILVEEVIFK